MSAGALDRSSLRANLSTLLGAASGVAESAHIDLEAGPQGRAHTYWSIASLSSKDAGSRGRRTTTVSKQWSVRLTYAHRINPKDRETTRDAALDNLDALERAIRNSSNAARASLSITDWTDKERLSGSREWLVWDIDLGILAAFDLAGS
jgi:hypothetical protein